MATIALIADSQKHETKDLSAIEETVTSEESTPLIEKRGQSNLERLRLRFRYRHQRYCLKSKAVTFSS